MKLATVIPPSSLWTCDEMHLSYHMAIAPYILKDPRYKYYYQQMSRFGGYIILDNGEAEGERLSHDNMIEVANIINADVIALPDVMGDLEATLSIATQAYHYYQIPPKLLMVIPQGRDAYEMATCLEMIMDEGVEFGTIGIPKHIGLGEGGRTDMLNYIISKKLYLKHHIHLLGCYENPWTECKMYRKEFGGVVNGIDTGAPIAYAQAGMTINSADAMKQHCTLDWETTNMDTDLVRYNIRRLTGVCNGTENSWS